MWSGYKDKSDIAEFLEFMREKGVRIVDWHTSGHADENTIRTLINKVNPSHIIPVHTENAQWYESNINTSIVYDKEFEV